MSAVHDFKEQLAFANNPAHDTMRQLVYPVVWGLDCHYERVIDLPTQRASVDYWVTSPHFPGRVAVEEKIRASDWPDVLLEYACGTRPGWIEKAKAKTDVLLYIMPRLVLVLPWPALRAAWVDRGERWKELGKTRKGGFTITSVPNSEYTAWSVAVPIPVIAEAVPGMTQIPRPKARRLLTTDPLRAES